jgi:hypothetical protein
VDEVYGKRPVLVGEWWSSMKRVQQSWKCTEGASSELGSAEKFYSGGGSYEKGTTYGKSSESDVTFPTTRGKVGMYFLWAFQRGDASPKTGYSPLRGGQCSFDSSKSLSGQHRAWQLATVEPHGAVGPGLEHAAMSAPASSNVGTPAQGPVR